MSDWMTCQQCDEGQLNKPCMCLLNYQIKRRLDEKDQRIKELEDELQATRSREEHWNNECSKFLAKIVEFEQAKVILAQNALIRSFENAELINRNILANKLIDKLADYIKTWAATTNGEPEVQKIITEFKAWKEKQ